MSSIFNYLHIKNECLGEAWGHVLKKLRAQNTNAKERTSMALQVVLKDCAKQVTIQQTNNDSASLGNLDERKLNRLIDALENGEVSEKSVRACEVGEVDNPHEIGGVETVNPESSTETSIGESAKVS